MSGEMKTKYDGYFQGIDKDHDGFISGEEARSLFMASNLPSNVLAHVWSVVEPHGSDQVGVAWHEGVEGRGLFEIFKEM